MSHAEGARGRVRRDRMHRAERALSPASMPPVPAQVPVDVERTGLYTAHELYGDGAYVGSPDAGIYAWSLAPGDRADQLARAMHDHAVDEALDAWLAGLTGLTGRRLVGVMGGHDAQRGAPGYVAAARLGHGLGAAGLVVATGGGPGAMEAANLGSLLATQPTATLDSALERLARAPGFHPVDDWLAPARDVLAGLRDADLHASLGVPTWFYGHEPTNVFATGIAKFFRNALREAILLQLCDAGIVFLPGAAGTVQEVFQDACENYYALGDAVAPMVLVGTDFWTSTLPAWPLLRTLAEGRAMADRIHLVDDVEQAVALLTGASQATSRR